MERVRNKIDGVVIGLLLGFDRDEPLVIFSGNTSEVAVRARSLIDLDSDCIGAELALMFEEGEPAKPLIVGRIVDPPRRKPEKEVKVDGRILKIEAKDRLELRCGDSTIIMEADGHITIRGKYVTSHASATNRVRGGSINLN